MYYTPSPSGFQMSSINGTYQQESGGGSGANAVLVDPDSESFFKLWALGTSLAHSTVIPRKIGNSLESRKGFSE